MKTDLQTAIEYIDEWKISQFFEFVKAKKGENALLNQLVNRFITNRYDENYDVQLRLLATWLLSENPTESKNAGEALVEKGTITKAEIKGNYNQVFQNIRESTIHNTNTTNNFYDAKVAQKPTHPLYIYVLSTTQGKTVCEENLLAQFPKHHYHETDCSLWKPFENEGTISQLIAEYKNEVAFDVKERFLEQNPILEHERPTFLKNMEKIILVVDPFALHTEHETLAKKFDKNEIGGCLVLLCQSVSFELFAYIRTKIETIFGDLRTCFLDYKEKYLHFIFPISTKELFFRTLSNIALLRLEIKTQIEDLDKQGKLQNKIFKF
jgi:hypothetical protein